MGYVSVLEGNYLTPKKHQKLKCALGGSQLFGSSYRKAVQPMVGVNGKLLVTGTFGGVWRAELENGWGDPVEAR